MKKLFIISYLLLVIILVGFLFLPTLTQAARVLPACTATGNCGICDFLQGFINVLRWIIGMTGGTALFLMVWNAFGWVVAGGSSEKIQKAKQGVVHTIIAIIIILGAWQAINIVIALTMGIAPGQKIGLFKNNENAWYQYCGQSPSDICQGRGDGSPIGNGEFCFNQAKVTNKDLDPCSATDRTKTFPAKNACEYWANLCPDQMGNNNPYQNYKCEKKDDCDPYENLGTAYCPEKDKSAQACCLKKPETPAPNP